MHRFKSCQQVEGKPADGKQCGEPCYERSSYCKAHHNRNYRTRDKPQNEADEFKEFSL